MDKYMKLKNNITGKYVNSAKYIKKICIYCNDEFEINESKLKHGKGKYCSRKCCDSHKKTTCKGEGNGAYGRHITELEKKMRSEISKKMWKNPINRDKIINGLNEFVKNNGYWPGSDEKSIQKRKNTFLKKYGVDHNWSVPEIREKCEESCIRLYGKSSIELARDILRSNKTNIEIIIENILLKNKILYETQYEINFNGIKKLYDFYIPNSNTLIEADGDFWHGNPDIYPYEFLLEIQHLNKKNDILKNDIANKLGYKLIRFWENEILEKNFETLLLEKI